MQLKNKITELETQNEGLKEDITKVTAALHEKKRENDMLKSKGNDSNMTRELEKLRNENERLRRAGYVRN